MTVTLESKDGTMNVNFYKTNRGNYIQYVFDHFIGNRNFITEEVDAEVFYKTFEELKKSGYKLLTDGF